MRIIVLFVTNLVQFNLMNEFRLIYKNSEEDVVDRSDGMRLLIA